MITVTTEASDVVNAAVDVLRPGGVVVGVGQFGMGLGRDRWFGAQATILPSIAYGPDVTTRYTRRTTGTIR